VAGKRGYVDGLSSGGSGPYDEPEFRLDVELR
jgi:hypothetical protein